MTKLVVAVVLVVISTIYSAYAADSGSTAQCHGGGGLGQLDAQVR